MMCGTCGTLLWILKRWGLQMVTGSWIGSEGTSTSLGTLPASLQQKLSQLAVDLDAAQLEIVNALAAEIGPPQILGEHLDIPLLSEKPEPSSGWKYGLLDVVRYRMGAESPDEVVAPHADPGLLILSLPRSTPGSRLWCSLGRWSWIWYRLQKWHSPRGCITRSIPTSQCLARALYTFTVVSSYVASLKWESLAAETWFHHRYRRGLTFTPSQWRSHECTTGRATWCACGQIWCNHSREIRALEAELPLARLEWSESIEGRFGPGTWTSGDCSSDGEATRALTCTEMRSIGQIGSDWSLAVQVNMGDRFELTSCPAVCLALYRQLWKRRLEKRLAESNSLPVMCWLLDDFQVIVCVVTFRLLLAGRQDNQNNLKLHR